MIVPWGGVLSLLEAGWLSLLDYLAAHVLLCLVPAFFIAGALSALVPKEAVTRFLGARAPKYVSYSAAAAGGFVLAVCSCTILPLFAGIWKRGAGIGPAMTFLFVGPAVNILAVSYTGAAIGMDVAVARIVLSISFGIAIGLIIAALFPDEATEVEAAGFGATGAVRPPVWILLLLLLGVLLAGTLQADHLMRVYATMSLPLDLPVGLAEGLERAHLTTQGALLIALLVLTAPVAYRGLNNILDRSTAWTWAALALVAITLLAATPTIELHHSLVIGITGRLSAEFLLLLGLVATARWGLTTDELSSWLWETWRFVKQIFPLLVAGVFIAGVLQELIPDELIRSIAGSNTPAANLVAVLFGVFMYFPTLVEVPIARMFLELGMHRGPLLAYLLADPSLSVQSILVTNKLIGGKRTATYVGLVAVFSTLAGYIFGAVVNAR